MSGDSSDAQVIVDTAAAAVEPVELAPGGLFSVVVPEGAQHKLIDLEGFLAVPNRKRGTAALHTATSFAEFVKTHDGGHVSIFGDVEAPSVVAVLNGDTTESAGWGDHRAVLSLRHPPAWKRWIGSDGKLGTQEQFAQHIETSLQDIVSPPAADMLELAQNFQAKTRVDFKSAKILSNGVRQLQYEETVDAKAGQKGQLDIPDSFTVALQPFEGSSTYQVLARLRYRIGDGTLFIGYQLDRPEEVLRSAFDDVLAEIEDTTGRKPYLGKAPARP